MTKTNNAALNRRMFLAAASSAAAWSFLNLRDVEAADRTIRTSDYPFKLGVASGDPVSDGVVLWTRLAPDPLNGGGMPPEDIRVRWQVATEEGMRRVVRKGIATASKDWAHAVQVEVQGLLPDRTYWYQFKVGQETSDVGRTRTAPAGDVMLDRFRFAFASCQHYEYGFFNALEHLAKEDLHAVVHLGDYIYEDGIHQGRARQHNSHEVTTLLRFRRREPR